MAIAQIRILSSDDIELVHAKTLHILQETGILVRSEDVLDVLEKGGASVDRSTMTARLPEPLIRETLRNMPKTAKLCARNPKQDMIAPRAGPPFMATNGTAIYMTDLTTGNKRTTTGKDLRDFMTLCDAMPQLDYVWPIVTAHDEPADTHALSELAISLQSTTKHVQGEAVSAHEARGEIEVAAAIVGGRDALSRRPIFSVIQCPICPLEFEKGSVEAVMEFAKAGIPVVSMSMALCGLTSPVTLAGTIAVVNAENLASFTISQMTKAGAPVIYSSESVAPNMITGEIHYGALEEMLLSSAAAQMAKHYGAPSMVGGFGVGLAGEYPGVNVDPAELFFTSSSCLTSTDFASGMGGLDQAKGAALEQIVIDCDLWEFFREMRKPVSIEGERFATDIVKSVGPGGTFLKDPHTIKNMRKELFLPSREKMELFGRYRLDRDPKEIVGAANKRARDILDSHRPEPLDRATQSKVEEILRKYQS